MSGVTEASAGSGLFVGEALEWFSHILPAREARLLAALRAHGGDVEAARGALGWRVRETQHARQVLAAAALTVTNAALSVEQGVQVTALSCVPEWGPWRDAVIATGQPSPSDFLGIAPSRWRGLRVEAEALMRAAHVVLSGTNGAEIEGWVDYACA